MRINQECSNSEHLTHQGHGCDLEFLTTGFSGHTDPNVKSTKYPHLPSSASNSSPHNHHASRTKADAASIKSIHNARASIAYRQQQKFPRFRNKSMQSFRARLAA